MVENKARKRIVVLDDSEDMLELIEIILTEEGYLTTLLRAWCGTASLENIIKCEPVLIIVDILLNQKVNGIDVINQLQSDVQTAQIPILVVTAVGKTHLELLQTAFGQSNLPILQKPFELQNFLERVETAIESQF